MRTVLAALALLAATSAFAELVKVAEIADTAYYVDSASRSDTANPRKVAVVQDYATQTRERRALEASRLRRRLRQRADQKPFGYRVFGTDGERQEREFVGAGIGLAVRRAHDGNQHRVENAVPGDRQVRLFCVEATRRSTRCPRASGGPLRDR